MTRKHSGLVTVDILLVLTSVFESRDYLAALIRVSRIFVREISNHFVVELMKFRYWYFVETYFQYDTHQRVRKKLN